MAKLEGAKEELGWLKVVFALSAAIDASLVAWLAQKYATADIQLLVAASITAVLVTAYIVRVNIVAYRRIREIKDLG